jgi:hypothetical protein
VVSGPSPRACLNGEGAPISAISGTPIGRPKSTSSGHLDAADTRTVWQTKTQSLWACAIQRRVEVHPFASVIIEDLPR